MLSDYIDHHTKLSPYKKYFPNINNLNDMFIAAMDEYSENLDQLEEIYLEEYAVHNKLAQLMIIYLVILHKPELIDRYKDYILNINVTSYNNKLIDDDQFILYSYIKEYIKNHEMKKLNKEK